MNIQSNITDNIRQIVKEDWAGATFMSLIGYLWHLFDHQKEQIDWIIPCICFEYYKWWQAT